MSQLGSAVVAGVAGALLGLAAQKLRWSPLVASCVAAIAGWFVGSVVAAAVWLKWPPDGFDVMAVSVSLPQAALFALAVVLFAVLFHLGVGALAGADSLLLANRPVLLGVMGALFGVLGFALGAGVKPVG